jgi:hypothetical protein
LIFVSVTMNDTWSNSIDAVIIVAYDLTVFGSKLVIVKRQLRLVRLFGLIVDTLVT